MEGLDAAGILQVDATIITGILILLTLAQTRLFEKYAQLSKGVASVVLPFVGSAVLLLVGISCDCWVESFQKASLILMTIGFVYVAVVVLSLTKLRRVS